MLPFASRMRRITIMHPTSKMFALSSLILALVTAQGFAGPTNLTVAADGSGQFKTIQEAIMVVPAGSRTNPVFIRIKPGHYKELVYVQREKRFFHLLGEDAGKTVLTYDLNAN